MLRGRAHRVDPGHGDRDGSRHGGHHFGGLLGAVHAEYVVPRRDDSFATVTYDRGKVVSVSGNELTIREGTADATYGTVTRGRRVLTLSGRGVSG